MKQKAKQNDCKKAKLVASSFHHSKDAKFLELAHPTSSRTVLSALWSVVCGRRRLLHTSCVVGLWSVVCGPRPRGKEELRPLIYHCTALHVCIPSIVVSALRVVLFVRGRLLLSETESSVIGTKRTTHGRFLARRGHRPSSSWHIHYRYCIERVWNHIHTQRVSLRLG